MCRQARGVAMVGPVGSHTMSGVDPHREVVRPAHPPVGQHGHHTLTPRPESPLVQLRAAHGVKAGDARDKWQGTLYHALYTIHIHTYVTV